MADGTHPPKQTTINQPFFSSDFFARLICICAFFLWVNVIIQKYYRFGYDDWDLALFSQAMFNLLHGSGYASIFDVNIFGNHSNFIAYLCLPFYALCPHPLTLVFLKLLSVILGGYLFYFLCKDKISPVLSLAIMTLYFIYPPNVYGILYEFDFESLAPVFLFLLYYTFKRNNFKLFALTSVILVLIKENMPLIVLAFGLWGLLAKDRDRIKWGMVPMVFGLTVFYLLTTHIIPYFRGAPGHGYLGYYKEFGNSPTQIIISVLTHPWKIIPHLQDPLNQRLILGLFAPVLFLSFLSPQILFLISPILLQHILSQSATERTIFYQYGLSVAPFIFLSTVHTLAFLKKYLRSLTYGCVWILLAATTLFYFHTNQPGFRARLASQPDYLLPYEWKMIKTIPRDSGVISTLSYLADLSARKRLYGFIKVYKSIYQPEENPFVTPPSVDYAMLNFDSGWLLAEFSREPKEVVKRIQKFYFHEDWVLKDSIQEVVLLQKSKSGPKLIDIDHGYSLDGSSRFMFHVDQKFSLISVHGQEANIKANSVLPLDFFWQSQKDISDHYLAIFEIKKGGKLFYRHAHPIGYKIYPTFEWKQNEQIKEKYSFYIPFLPPGEYSLDMHLVNLSDYKTATLKFGDGKFVSSYASIRRFTIP